MAKTRDTRPVTSYQSTAAQRVHLFGRRQADISLTDAISASGISDGVALLASAARYVVARVRGGRLHVLDAARRGEVEMPLPGAGLAAVFEARLFDGTVELRWLHTSNGLGEAALLAEQADSVAGRLAEPIGKGLSAIDRIDGRYLLWGSPLRSGTPAGWTTLAEARIGLLDVPVDMPVAAPAGADCRVFLRYVEYVAVDPRHHNAFVAQERLVDLVADTTEPETTEPETNRDHDVFHDHDADPSQGVDREVFDREDAEQEPAL